MPFPFIFHENFESGTLGGFTSEPDTLGRLDFPDHNDDLSITPWRGGYVMRVDLNRGVTEAYVEQDSVLDMIEDQTRYLRFQLYLGNFRMPVATSMKILSIFSGITEEVSVGLTRAGSQINSPRLSIWSPDDGEWQGGLGVDVDRWMSVEFTVYNHSTTGRAFLHRGDNTLQVGRMVHAPFTHFRLGAMAQNPDVRGTLYFDDFLIDQAKLEEPTYVDPRQLSGETLLFTKSSYAFVGPGRLRGATLISGGTNNRALFHDTDRLPLVHHDIKAGLQCSSAESKDTLIEEVRFKRGCYINMTGTNPQVIVHYGNVGEQPSQPAATPPEAEIEAEAA